MIVSEGRAIRISAAGNVLLDLEAFFCSRAGSLSFSSLMIAKSRTRSEHPNSFNRCKWKYPRLSFLFFLRELRRRRIRDSRGNSGVGGQVTGSTLGPMQMYGNERLSDFGRPSRARSVVYVISSHCCRTRSFLSLPLYNEISGCKPAVISVCAALCRTLIDSIVNRRPPALFQ